MRTFSRALVAVLAGTALAGCDNSGVDLGFGTIKTNVVRATVYLDRDGSHGISAVDTTYSGARVALLQRGTTDTVASVLTDSRGVALLTNVALGEYSVAVSPVGLGDSVLVAAIDTSIVLPSTNKPTIDIKVSLQRDTTDVLVRLSYPELNIRQARNAVPGKRVFIRGIVLAGIQSFADRTTHIADTTDLAIRLTGVTLKGGIVSNPPGDSVTVLGLTGSLLGQPSVVQAAITRLAARPAPIPLSVSTFEAATAKGGTLDANLVRITNALISDTGSISPDYKVVVSDGTGSVTIVLDGDILNFNLNAFVPGRHVNARGVLVPDGAGGWTLKPRDPTDVAVF
jgi:hypothetical protein